MGVVGMKLGTKAFGQTTEKPTGTVNIEHNVGAENADKIGGENVGEVLNKIADANWVDPSKKMRAVGNANLDKDAFFKLMLTQMKNQDPTNPLKPHEMSAQLANFSALEQMTNINQTLQKMEQAQKPTEQFQALSLIGKAVSGDSAKIVRVKGDKLHDIRFTLPAASSEVEVKIKNSAGETVRAYSMKKVKEGANSVTWNGLDENGTATIPDEYTAVIEAKGSDGQKLAVKTDFEGVINGVNYTPEGPVLMVGKQTVRLRDLRRIIDPGLMKNDQKSQNPTQEPLKTEVAPQQTEESVPGAPDRAAAAPNLMDNVALSREMMSKVQKAMNSGS